jgi:CubicO group peptidase (beta-lactamase class C family)
MWGLHRRIAVCLLELAPDGALLPRQQPAVPMNIFHIPAAVAAATVLTASFPAAAGAASARLLHAAVSGAGLETALPASGEVPPESVGLDPARLALVDSAILRAVEDSAAPGVALAIGRYGRLVRLRGYGRIDWHPLSPAVTDSTLFDLASLTKAMGTATVAMQLVREARLDLDMPISRYLPSWPGWGMYGQITCRHLLAHTSGLPPGTNLRPRGRNREERIASLAQLKVRYRPGTHRQYSDVGMILLGAVLERVTGSRLDDLVHVRVLAPLAMGDTRFNPLAPLADRSSFTLARIAATEQDSRVRHTLVHGVVHDLNAWALDGVAGHAGMFSSARDMAVFAQALLDAAQGYDTPIFPAGSFLAWTQRERAFGRPLGWDVPTGESSAAGEYFSSASIGHTGFTGTSIWVDPERDLFVVLLTNRLNPSARNRRHIQLRRDVHDLVQLAIADMVVARRE